MSETETIPISVWLSPGKLRLNFCMICRDNLHLQVEGYPKQLLVGIDASTPMADNYRPLKFPIKVRCPGRSQIHGRCPALWVIQGYIDE